MLYLKIHHAVRSPPDVAADACKLYVDKANMGVIRKSLLAKFGGYSYFLYKFNSISFQDIFLTPHIKLYILKNFIYFFRTYINVF